MVSICKNLLYEILKMNRNISIEIIYQVYEHVNSGVVLGQNCIQLSDTALNDLFFFQEFVLSKAVQIC